MTDHDRIADLQACNGALRAAVDRFVLRAGPMTQQDLDRIASELAFTGDTVEDLERTYANLRRRAELLVEHKVVEASAFDGLPRPA